MQPVRDNNQDTPVGVPFATPNYKHNVFGLSRNFMSSNTYVRIYVLTFGIFYLLFNRKIMGVLNNKRCNNLQKFIIYILIFTSIIIVICD